MLRGRKRERAEREKERDREREQRVWNDGPIIINRPYSSGAGKPARFQLAETLVTRLGDLHSDLRIRGSGFIE